MKRSEWIIKVYSRLAGPVLECEGGAVLHFLFKCFKCIKVSILGKCISVTVVHAISATTTKRTHLTCITHTQRFFSLTLSCVVLPNVTLAHKDLWRVASAYTRYSRYLATQEVLNGAILTSCNVISPTYSSVTSANSNPINFVMDEPIFSMIMYI